MLGEKSVGKACGIHEDTRIPRYREINVELCDILSDESDDKLDSLSYQRRDVFAGGFSLASPA
jgi:hypothetical protein